MGELGEKGGPFYGRLISFRSKWVRRWDWMVGKSANRISMSEQS